MNVAGLQTPIVRRRLTPVSAEERRLLLEGAETGMPHADAWRRVNAMRELQIAGYEDAGTTPATSMKVGAWNVQHCHFPDQSAALLSRNGFDLVLLSELDIGMRRTGQVNAPERLAYGQGHGYGFAVEFLELRSPDGVTPETTGGAENVDGFHGNGFTSRQRPLSAAIVRLEPEADWFERPRRNQTRVGGRMAVAAQFELGDGQFTAVSVHLESDTDRTGRGRQMRSLLEGIERLTPRGPVIIGGDFNAGARHPDFDASIESLFEIADQAGYSWFDCNAGLPTSRVSRVTNAVQQARAHYDWFFVRGLAASNPEVIAAVDEQGNALSDHEIISVTVAWPDELAT